MNIISELTLEIARVERMAAAKKLDAYQAGVVQATIRNAKFSLAMNQYEVMRETLDELREIGKDLKPDKPEAK